VPKRSNRPVRSDQTLEAYARRYNQLVAKLRRSIARSSGQDEAEVKVTPARLATFLIDRKSHYAACSWRVVRSSVIWAMEEIAIGAEPLHVKEIGAAIARLLAEEPEPDENRPIVTSRTKAKGCSLDDAYRIRHAALATRAPAGVDLATYVNAARLTGLRQCEWAHAILRKSERPGHMWELVVANAKNSNGRTHGPHRTLYWTDLSPDLARDVLEWIAVASSPDYATRLDTIGKLLNKLTRKLFPCRTERPTLSSMRHEAVARWKAHYCRRGKSDEEHRMALATVAALMGHGSDESATKHYARASSGSAEFPVPAADPVEIARVRQVLDLEWRRKLAPKPPSRMIHSYRD
jgi:hypothetical protein